jgi:hypothetical protein
MHFISAEGKHDSSRQYNDGQCLTSRCRWGGPPGGEGTGLEPAITDAEESSPKSLGRRMRRGRSEAVRHHGCSTEFVSYVGRPCRAYSPGVENDQWQRPNGCPSQSLKGITKGITDRMQEGRAARSRFAQTIALEHLRKSGAEGS